MSQDPRKRQSSENPWLDFLWTLLFFAGLPIMLLAAGRYFLETNRWNRLREETFSRLDKTLFRLKQEGSDINFVQNRLNFNFGLLSEEPLEPKAVQRAVKRFAGSGLGFVKVHFFDENGEFIHFPAEDKDFHGVLKRIFNSLSEPEVKGTNDLMERNRATFQAFLGAIEPKDVVYEKSNLLKVQIAGSKPGYFFWNTFYRSVPSSSQRGPASGPVDTTPTFQGGMVAFLVEEALPKDLAIKTMVREFNRTSDSPDRFVFLDLDKPVNSFPRKEIRKEFGVSTTYLQKLTLALRKKFARHVAQSFGFFAVYPIDPGKVVAGISPIDRTLSNRIAILLLVISALILGFTATWGYRIHVSGAVHFIPIRQKLVALFLYATAIPVTSFLLLGYQYSADSRQVLIQAKLGDLSDYIANIDDNFSTAIQALENLYVKLCKSRIVKRQRTTVLEKLAAKWRTRDLAGQIFLLNRKGGIVFSSMAKKSKDLINRFIPTLGRKLYEARFGTDFSNLKNAMSDVMVESLTDSVAEMVSGGGRKAFSDIFQKTDKIQEVWLGTTGNFIYSSFVFQPGQPHPTLVIILSGRKDFSARYLKGVIDSINFRPEAAFPIRLARIARSEGKSTYPRGFSQYPWVRDLFEKVSTTQTQHSSIENMGGVTYLVTASPLKKIPDFILFAVYPKNLIDREIFRSSMKIGFIAIMSGFFALFVGLKLARNILWPINELAAGISEIEKRNFEYRIPPLDQDELGVLGNTFNRVISSLEELSIGRVVQETLFPRKPLEVGDFEISGISRTMTDLGGDYFDYFPISDRYLIAIMGDVTGHGVPAALLMSMAKGAISMLSPEEAVDAERALARLNTLILETMKKKRLMTMAYCVVDTRTCSIVTANAGHNYPYYIPGGKNLIRQIEIPAFPLGARKKHDTAVTVQNFGPGDVLVLYTDGFVESKTPRGPQLGFPRFGQLLLGAATRSATAREVVSRILTDFDEVIRGETPDDDQTLVVIRRKQRTNPQNA